MAAVSWLGNDGKHLGTVGLTQVNAIDLAKAKQRLGYKGVRLMHAGVEYAHNGKAWVAVS